MEIVVCKNNPEKNVTEDLTLETVALSDFQLALVGGGIADVIGV